MDAPGLPTGRDGRRRSRQPRGPNQLPALLPKIKNPRFRDPALGVEGKITILPSESTNSEILRECVENNQVVGFSTDDVPGYLDYRRQQMCYICPNQHSSKKTKLQQFRTCYTEGINGYQVFCQTVYQCQASKCPMVFIKKLEFELHYKKEHNGHGKNDHMLLKIVWGGINDPSFLGDPQELNYGERCNMSDEDMVMAQQKRMESSYEYRFRLHLEHINDPEVLKKSLEYGRDRFEKHPRLYRELTRLPCQVEVPTTKGKKEPQVIHDVELLEAAISTPYYSLLFQTNPALIPKFKDQSGDNTFVCFQCGEESTNHDEAGMHLTQVHGIALLRVHVCLADNCRQIYENETRVAEHIRTCRGSRKSDDLKLYSKYYLLWNWQPKVNGPTINNPRGVIQDKALDDTEVYEDHNMEDLA